MTIAAFSVHSLVRCEGRIPLFSSILPFLGVRRLSTTDCNSSKIHERQKVIATLSKDFTFILEAFVDKRKSVLKSGMAVRYWNRGGIWESQPLVMCLLYQMLDHGQTA